MVLTQPTAAADIIGRDTGRSAIGQIYYIIPIFIKQGNCENKIISITRQLCSIIVDCFGDIIEYKERGERDGKIQDPIPTANRDKNSALSNPDGR